MLAYATFRRGVWVMPFLSLLLLSACRAAEGDGVVSFVKVLSDKVEDVSSMEAWKRTFISNTMTDEQKAVAIFNSIPRFRVQDAPPNECLQYTGNVHDPIKVFNVYGYGQCCCASATVEAFSRYVGLRGRGWAINSHSVPEVSWDSGTSWHMFDTSLINYFPKPDGKIASIAEIMTAVNDWYTANPGYKGNSGALTAFWQASSWQGWKNGPALLTACPFYSSSGWWPAGTHGWGSTMQEYDGSTNFEYDYGYSQGYQVNNQLRPGEKLLFNWSNTGLHINMDGDGGVPGCLAGGAGAWAANWGDLNPGGRVGNGKLEYDVPLATGQFVPGALQVSNLAATIDDGLPPAVHVQNAAQPGILIIRRPSSFVYLGGTLTFTAVVGSGGAITVAYSDNNGLDWTQIANVAASGNQSINLKPNVFRRYDYRLKFTFNGAGTGLNALKITHDIQHSQRALPALDAGANTITFSAGPAEGTVTIEANTDTSQAAKNLIPSNFHPTFNNVTENMLQVPWGSGSVTFPISTPGDMVRLRLGGQYRLRNPADKWDYQVSFDNGATYTTIATATVNAPSIDCAKYVTYSNIPAGTRNALVRFSGTCANTTCMFVFRIDADYVEPNGIFRPVKVTYNYQESGVTKQDVHIARSANETYSINCAVKPVMTSLVLELTPNEAPVIASITATPNPALVGETITFTAAASDADTDPLTYTWNFGDTATATGSSVTHAYASAGIYSATVTVADRRGGVATSSVSVNVTASGGGGGGGGGGGDGGTDSDGDGFSDTQEINSGTNPQDATSYPGGPGDCDHDGIPDDVDADDDGDGISDLQEGLDGTNPYDPSSGKKLPLTVTKMMGSVKFCSPGQDGCAISGVIPNLPAGFDPANASALLDVGGVQTTFTLDAKGKAKNGSNTLQLRLKLVRDKATRKSSFLGGDVPFKAKLTHGSCANAWANEGVDPNADKTNAAMCFVVNLTLNGALYGTAATASYSSKAGKGGKFKK